MCGRMNVHDYAGVQAFLDELGLSLGERRFNARYNVCPTDPVEAVFAAPAPRVAVMRWGFAARGPKQRGPLINARAETVWQRPAFCGAMHRRRAVVPVNGFYEWRREGSSRLPYYVTGKQPVLALAGLYEVDAGGEMRCCVLTTEANEVMRTVHDRMPVVLAHERVMDWLGDDERDVLDALIADAATQPLHLERVSTFVNNVRNDGPECMQPVAG